jgi:hypothetical protein
MRFNLIAFSRKTLLVQQLFDPEGSLSLDELEILGASTRVKRKRGSLIAA